MGKGYKRVQKMTIPKKREVGWDGEKYHSSYVKVTVFFFLKLTVKDISGGPSII